MSKIELRQKARDVILAAIYKELMSPSNMTTDMVRSMSEYHALRKEIEVQYDLLYKRWKRTANETR